MNTLSNAHINQLCEEDNSLRTGSILIKCKISKNGRWLIAESATEYTVEETEEETIETESQVNLSAAMNEWDRPIEPAKLIDGLVAAYCADFVWRKVAWIEGGKVQALSRA